MPLKELLQRQWCGRLGKKENCQAAIFLVYASRMEFALVDRRLYLPQEWIEDKSRCNKAGIPQEHQVMKTRHTQSLEMIVGRGKKLPHKWIAGDDEMDKVPWFCRDLLAQNEPYMFAVPSNLLICDLETPGEYCKKCGQEFEREFINVRDWAKNIPTKKWKTIKARQGHKGWLTVKLVKCQVRAKIENEIGHEETLVVSKWREDNGKPRCDYRRYWFAFGDFFDAFAFRLFDLPQIRDNSLPRPPLGPIRLDQRPIDEFFTIRFFVARWGRLQSETRVIFWRS